MVLSNLSFTVFPYFPLALLILPGKVLVCALESVMLLQDLMISLV